MAPNPRVGQAFRAMKEIGISEEKVKPVLKKLLKLYEKNWELIESENYGVLADAIFDEEDSKVSEPKKDKKCDEEDIEEEGSVPNELVRPLKRIRLKKQDGLASCSHRNDSSNVAGTFLKRPKVEEDELPPASLQQWSLQYNVGNISTEFLPASPGPVSPQPASPAPVSPRHGGMNKGKQTVEPRPLAVLERSEPNSYSSQMHVSYKRKEPVSPHVASNGKGLERVSLALRIKDPAPEPGIIPKKRVPDIHALIIPKEEPLTDDIPEDEVPIAVIHPDSLSGRDLPIGNFSTGKSNWQEPPDSLHADEIVGVGASGSMSERRTSCDLATVPDEIPSSLEIASSPLGEVKISLSYNSALGRPNFQLPSIDEIRELMEQRCLRSYKLIDPNFDVIKILSDMCKCISELATNFSNRSQEGNVIPAFDVLKKSPARDALDAESYKENGCLPAWMLNGSFNVQCSANECVDNMGGNELVVVLHHQLTPNELRWLHDASDITKGEEKVKISWVFLTPDGKGWGLRTLEKLPKGAFVCEFVGEILTICELYARNIEKYSCPILLDAYWGLKVVSKNEEVLCLDATCFGNVARFINHRCLDGNLIEIPVEVETPDLHYYHLAFFTTREVHALEELTWDYGIDFDDLDHPVKAFRCRYGSKFCRF
ncbi:hypothetical protein CRYUN_Cryun14cG0118500 [Craigia yunnanensis]